MSDAAQVQREVPDRVRRHIYWNNGTLLFLIFSGGAWLISGAYALFSLDLFGWLEHEKNTPKFNAYLYSILAVFAPVATAIVAWFRIRRALHLARYGVEVTAVVKSMRGLTHGGCNLHFEYVIGSQTIATRTSTATVVAQEFLDGRKPLVLIVDPNKPKRFMMECEVFPSDDK